MMWMQSSPQPHEICCQHPVDVDSGPNPVYRGSIKFSAGAKVLRPPDPIIWEFLKALHEAEISAVTKDLFHHRRYRKAEQLFTR